MEIPTFKWILLLNDLNKGKKANKQRGADEETSHVTEQAWEKSGCENEPFNRISDSIRTAKLTGREVSGQKWSGLEMGRSGARRFK